MTTATVPATLANQPAATVHVGGQGHELIEGVTWTGLGGLGLFLTVPAAATATSVWPFVFAVGAAAFGAMGFARLFVRKRVELNRRGGAEVTRTAAGVAFGGYDIEDGAFDFVSVHDVRNDRVFGTGLKQMIRDMFRPQFELSLMGENDKEYLAMHWSRESALAAAQEISEQAGLDVYDRTVA